MISLSVFAVTNIFTHTSLSLRSSVCRMSSRDKINVQDQSKERGVSGGLGLNDESESSPGLSLSLSLSLSYTAAFKIFTYMKHTCTRVQSV